MAAPLMHTCSDQAARFCLPYLEGTMADLAIAGFLAVGVDSIYGWMEGESSRSAGICAEGLCLEEER